MYIFYYIAISRQHMYSIPPTFTSKHEALLYILLFTIHITIRLATELYHELEMRQFSYLIYQLVLKLLKYFLFIFPGDYIFLKLFLM